ncbi:gephyrin-like molybdotransferase receptor GlpR [Streptomyces sp. NPDC005438]|uniref:divisome protein SepX/GlpR n=1 Tax=Streptomyces sp. NPDC005438 TaxID=3156880 RepID=UPI0033B7816F
MSSSGLFYAVIVGAWAAYLVPMWLRRQDELNEARPTERFSTAIRLLSRKGAMERRYHRDAERREESQVIPLTADGLPPAGAVAEDPEPSTEGAGIDKVDLRGYASPKTIVRRPVDPPVVEELADREETEEPEPHEEEASAPAATPERGKRAQVLARRRRTTMVLFLAFTLGSVVAAVGGIRFLWAPAVPAVLLSAYIAHLRASERRRFAVTMDRQRGEEAARRLKARRGHGEEHPADPTPAPRKPARRESSRRAVVEQTDHAEWVDQQRDSRRRPGEEGWEPVPVPLPTYVNAPVAPRNTEGVDLDGPDTWSSARSTSVDDGEDRQPRGSRRPRPPRAPRESTPLFDQYAGADDDPGSEGTAEEGHRRASNE